jgi:hypothetical protein
VTRHAPVITLRLEPSSHAASAARWHGYRLAGRELLTDRPLEMCAALPGEAAAADEPVLGAWGAAAPVQPDVPAIAPPDHPAPGTKNKTIFDGPGWLGGVERRVISRIGPRGYELEVAGVGLFRVAADGRAAACVSVDSAATATQVEEAATGIALVLALALQGVFCLHAGAVRVGDAVVAAIGESGSGKSTLVHWLSDTDPAAWPLVADDVLAMERLDSGITVRPDFPQPRLPSGAQPGLHFPPQLPLGAVFVLDTFDHPRPGAVDWATGTRAAPSRDPIGPIAEGRGDRLHAGSLAAEVSADRLSPAKAAHALARHTIALRLFGQRLAERHISFCADVVQQTEVVALRYPRVREALPLVASIVSSRLSPRP